MNKAELVDAMASGSGLSKADAKRALDAFVDATSGALKSGDRISLVGFGSFSISKREARNGRNPKTGAVIKIAAKMQCVLKQVLNYQQKLTKKFFNFEKGVRFSKPFFLCLNPAEVTCFTTIRNHLYDIDTFR